mgnify:CR=1 FL=1
MLPELKMMIGIRYLLKQWKNTHLLNNKMDVLLSGSLEDRARLILDCQEEVKSIEQRIKEESSDDLVARLEALQKVEEVTEEDTGGKEFIQNGTANLVRWQAYQ